jgi:hypothetical protein
MSLLPGYIFDTRNPRSPVREGGAILISRRLAQILDKTRMGADGII